MIDKREIANWKVMVVDDEPDSLEVVTRVLTFHGATVCRASNGKDALAVVEREKPTLILSDLSMPVMDGWELLYHLQANPTTEAIPVVALTAHAMPGDRERAVGAGFQYYLTKPLSPLTFLDDLLRLLEGLPPRRVAGLTFSELMAISTEDGDLNPTEHANGNGSQPQGLAAAHSKSPDMGKLTPRDHG